jgi:uncharacterized membrane protein YcaP (DUF421 family)
MGIDYGKLIQYCFYPLRFIKRINRHLPSKHYIIDVHINLERKNEMDMYIGIATKMLIGAIGIFAIIRIMGKKAMSELTPFDLIYVVILGALVEESLYDDKVNFLHVVFAIVLWGLVVYVVETILAKTERLSSVFQGEPSILIDKGKLNLKELNNNHFDMEQLRSMLRQSNCHSINDAYYAILEVNGALTVITKEKMENPTFLLVEEGRTKSKILKSLNKDEEWLRTKLADAGYPNIANIIYCEWRPEEEELIVETYDNTINRKIYIDD